MLHAVPGNERIIGLKSSVASAMALLMDSALASRDVKTIEANILAELMTKGGKLIDYLTICHDQDNHPFVHSDVFYHVTVQGQSRFYLTIWHQRQLCHF